MVNSCEAEHVHGKKGHSPAPAFRALPEVARGQCSCCTPTRPGMDYAGCCESPCACHHPGADCRAGGATRARDACTPCRAPRPGSRPSCHPCACGASAGGSASRPQSASYGWTVCARYSASLAHAVACQQGDSVYTGSPPSASATTLSPEGAASRHSGTKSPEERGGADASHCRACL